MFQLPRFDFYTEWFDQIIVDKGYDLVHYRSLLCPCISKDTGLASPNCTLCENGYQYWSSENIKGLISGISKEKQFSEPGGFLMGTMNLTVFATVKLSFHDRIVHTDSTIPYSQLIIRGDSGSTDRIRFPVISVDRVTTNINGAVVNYTETTDYSVSGRDLTWVKNKGPSLGAVYSITYQHNPVWLVMNNSHLIRDTHVGQSVQNEVFKRMPVQALCKLEFLVEP